MHRISLIALCSVIPVIGVALSTVATKPEGLRIINKAYDSEIGTVSFELLNTSDKTITAWDVALAISDARGRGVELGKGMDAYHSLVMQEAALQLNREMSISPAEIDQFLPGQSVAVEMEVGPAAVKPSAMSLVVELVVYEDTSFEGDPKMAERCFQNRASHVGERAAAIAILRSEERKRLSPADLASDLRRHAELLLGETREDRAAANDSSSQPERITAVAPRLAGRLARLADQIEDRPDLAQVRIDWILEILEAEQVASLKHLPRSASAPEDSQ